MKLRTPTLFAILYLKKQQLRHPAVLAGQTTLHKLSSVTTQKTPKSFRLHLELRPFDYRTVLNLAQISTPNLINTVQAIAK
jgi:hypothetical protein